MVITATEAKTNFGKYIQIATEEDVFITKNGYTVCRMTKPEVDRTKVLKELTGVVKLDDVDEYEMKMERISKQ